MSKYPKKSVIIDYNTLHITGINPKQLLKLWKDENVLIYDGSKGNEPFVVQEPYNSKVKLVDISKMSDEEIMKAFKKYRDGKKN